MSLSRSRCNFFRKVSCLDCNIAVHSPDIGTASKLMTSRLMTSSSSLSTRHDARSEILSTVLSQRVASSLALKLSNPLKLNGAEIEREVRFVELSRDWLNAVAKSPVITYSMTFSSNLKQVCLR